MCSEGLLTMYISEISISNFKSYGKNKEVLRFSTPNGEISSGLNILVGENNTGKSTLFEAIDFLRNGTRKSTETIENRNSNAPALVEITFQGNIEEIIDGFSQENKKTAFKKYIYERESETYIKLSRSTSDVKTIRLWDNMTESYNNESGIDAPLRKLFETNFVWADTNPNDEASFGSTTVCGNLLKEIASNFTATDEYKEFNEKFQKTFNSEESGLRHSLQKIEERTQQIFKEQFGSAQISFRFNELKVDSFFKNTFIDIDDGVTTPMDEKGSGMQRAVALALLQVFAEELIKHPDKDDLAKPFFLFIDEPEICLHPKAQLKLFEALLKLSNSKQIFLATHSPFFVRTTNLSKIGLFVFKAEDGHTKHQRIMNDNKLLPWSPTWGEIIFKAYDLPTIEFHNELYGYLQALSEKYKIHDFEEWLENAGIFKTKTWIIEKNGTKSAPNPTTIQTFIRHKIHHPENSTMQAYNYSDIELKESINQMINLIQKEKN